MKLKKLFILALAIIPMAGYSQTVKFAVEGKVNAKLEGKFIKLIYVDLQPKKIDSVAVKKGTFKFAGTLTSPTLARLSTGTEDVGDKIDIFLGEGLVRVIAKDSIHRAVISGTKLALDHEQLAKQLRPTENMYMGALLAFKKMPEGEAKKAYITKVLKGLDDYQKFRRETIHNFVSANPNSYVSLYYLDKSAPGVLMNYEATFPSYAKLSPELKATALGKKLEARILATKGTLMGKPYTVFTGATPEGKTLSSQDIISANKYTLIDFWASWCGPCRKENPNVVKAFTAFKDKGFTVLSVSLDEDGAKWKAAIESDGMPWYHVSNLKGWKEPIAALYGIRAIPQNVLVDAQGKIVATNLRAETLYNRVQELLGKNM